MSYNGIKEIRDTLDELVFLHQLNMEFFEALTIVLKHLSKYSRENNVPFNEETRIAMERVISIIDQMTNLDKTVIAVKSLKLPESIRRNFTGDESDEDLTEPKYIKEYP